MEALARFFSWLFKRLAFGLLLVVLGAVALGVWVYLQDRVDFDLRRMEVVRALTGETKRLEAALADVQARMAGMRTELAAAEARAVESMRLARELEEMSSGLNRLTTDSAQLRENRDRMARLRKMEAESRAKAAELQESLTRTQWEKDGLEIAIGRLSIQLKEVEARTSQVEHYAFVVWERYGRSVLIGAVVVLLAPLGWRVFAYFALAPAISSRRAMRLADGASSAPVVSESRTALDVTLRPGDVLWIKEKFLQASDEGLKKKTKTLLDWRMPFTCLATGLVEMIEVRNDSDTAAGRATFSSQESAQTELAIVALDEGSSLVLRPRFLAGTIGAGGRRVHVRRRWRLFAVQSWATGQFRHFEFAGPARLVVAGMRGVRAERLEPDPGNPRPARRTNREATIGFSPALGYRPVRAETFWAYFRGMNPLFDDRFEGEGVFLCQETSAKDGLQERGAGGRLWNGVLRLFGV